MIADRHVVMGTGGTAITSSSAVLLVDAAPDSAAVRRSESALAEAPDVDALADRLVAAHHSFAAAIAAGDGVAVIVAGEGVATLDDRDEVRHRPGGDAWTLTAAGGDTRIVLALVGQPDPTGQWLTTGVIAAGAVAVGRLRPSGARPASGARPTATSAAGGVANATPPPEPGPAARPHRGGVDDIDFGSLVGSASRAGSDPGAEGSSSPLGDLTPDVSPSPAAPPPSRTDPTAAFVPDRTPAAVASSDAVDGDRKLHPGGLVFSDGQRASLDAPVVVGRRPPSDPIAGMRPHRVTVDDRLLSRHHATFRLLDDHLVVVDEESTNGTFLLLADGARERCAAGRPIEVPAGATVDIGGVVTVMHERGVHQPGSSSC